MAPGAWQLPISYRSVGAAVIVGDVVLVFLLCLATGALYHAVRLGEVGDLVPYCGIGLLVSLGFALVMRGKDLYEPVALLDLSRQIRAVGLSWLGVVATFAAAAILIRVSVVFSRGAMLMLAVGGLVALAGHRVLWARALASARVRRRFRGPRVALVTLAGGEGTALQGPAHQGAALQGAALQGAALLERHGYRLAQAIDLSRVPDAALPDALAAAFGRLRGCDVAEVFIAGGRAGVVLDDAFLAALRGLPLPVRLVPARPVAALLRRPARAVGATLTVELHRGPLDPFEQAVKRAFDLVLAGLGLLLLSPLLCLVALAVHLDAPGPVFFRQSRTGFNGRSFRILKFRSMRVTEDGPAIVQARRGDARVTRVGRWIRRTSVDELPQLLNVLRGEMSLVGPRPHALAHDDHYAGVIGNYAFRHHMKPGLTGWAQVNGHRGETRTLDAMARRVEHDLWYVDHWTVWLDLTIVVRTALGVLSIRNVY